MCKIPIAQSKAPTSYRTCIRVLRVGFLQRGKNRDKGKGNSGQEKSKLDENGWDGKYL